VYLARARSEMGQCLLFARLFPDAHEFGLNLATLASRDGIQHIALLMHETARARGSRKQLRERCEQSLMPIGHEQVDARGASRAHILQQASPSIFVLLGAGAQGEYLFVACRIDAPSAVKMIVESALSP
jgi:hypothetical protein